MPQYPILDIVDLPLATPDSPGLMSAEDKTKVDEGVAGGLPIGTTLDDIDDGADRFAVDSVALGKLAAYTLDDGKAGDTHAAIVTGNPHGTVLADIGAAAATDLTALSDAVDVATSDLADLTATVGTISSDLDIEEAALAVHLADEANPHATTAAQVGSPTTSDFNTLAGRVDDLEGAGPAAGLRWIYGPDFVRDIAVGTDLPAAETVWSGLLIREMNLSTASKIRGYCVVTTGGTSTSVVRPQYTTDLTGASGWTSITGMDISLDVAGTSGIYSAEITVPAGAKDVDGVLLRLVSQGGNATEDPAIGYYTIDVLDSASVTGSGGATLPIDLSDTTDSSASGGRLAMTTAERSKLGGIAAGADVNTVTSVFGRTGAITSGSSDYTAAQVGAPSLATYNALASTVGGHTTSIATLNSTVAGHTSSISTLQSDLTALAARVTALETSGPSPTTYADVSATGMAPNVDIVTFTNTGAITCNPNTSRREQIFNFGEAGTNGNVTLAGSGGQTIKGGSFTVTPDTLAAPKAVTMIRPTTGTGLVWHPLYIPAP